MPTSSLQQFGFAIIFFFPLLALVVVCLRLYSRIRTKQLGADDHIVVLAMALSLAQTGTSFMLMRTNYIGIHAADIPPDYDRRTAMKWNFVVQVLYNPILALVKTSILLFLLKLGSQKPAVRRAVHLLNAFNLALMAAIFLVVIFQCQPMAANWDAALAANARCIDKGLFFIVTAGLTIFTDLLTLALPFWVFLDLKMPVRVKIVLLFVFLLGGVVTAVSIVRLVLLYRMFMLPPGPDPTYDLAFCLSAIETNLAIICASAPSLRPLFRSWFPRFFSFSSAHRRTSQYHRYYPSRPSRKNSAHLPSHSHSHSLGRASRAILSSCSGSQPSSGKAALPKKDIMVTTTTETTNTDTQHNNTTNTTNTNGTVTLIDSPVASLDDMSDLPANSFPLRDFAAPATRSPPPPPPKDSPSTSEEEILSYGGVLRTLQGSATFGHGRRHGYGHGYGRSRGSGHDHDEPEMPDELQRGEPVGHHAV